jgi:hypothetical protein
MVRNSSLEPLVKMIKMDSLKGFESGCRQKESFHG